MIDKKTFKIIRRIIKKHLSYLEKRNILIEPCLKNNNIEFKIKQTKRGGTKIRKNKALLAANRLMLLLINLNDNI
ncbi:MAG: hypothetical protein QXV64_03395 [Candidatus Anstonellaceae archaeon]